MKRLIVVLVALGLVGLTTGAMAFNYHTNVNLICSDCHTAHASQSHSNGDARGGIFQNVPIVNGPHPMLLRNAVNDLCLTCHDGNSVAPDVYATNTGKYAGTLREAGALNKLGDGNENNGHTLGWTGAIPGSDGSTAPTTLAGTDGLECVMCHGAHGSKTQYRNLLSRNAETDLTAGGTVSFLFAGRNLTYEINPNPTSVTNTKDVVMTAEQDYSPDHIQFEEPATDSSRYGNWCKTCHTNFHGSGGSAEMGSVSGGVLAPGGEAWLRHPTADVNIGGYRMRRRLSRA